jgi:hypothetical protein
VVETNTAGRFLFRSEAVRRYVEQKMTVLPKDYLADGFLRWLWVIAGVMLATGVVVWSTPARETIGVSFTLNGATATGVLLPASGAMGFGNLKRGSAGVLRWAGGDCHARIVEESSHGAAGVRTLGFSCEKTGGARPSSGPAAGQFELALPPLSCHVPGRHCADVNDERPSTKTNGGARP